MRRIGIDARLYSQTGVGTYLRNLLFYLDKINPQKESYYVYLQKKDASRVEFKSKNIVKRIADQKWHSFSEQTGFLLLLLKDNLDLMHFTYFSYPILYWRKFVSTIHDTTPLLFKTGRASTKNQLIYQIKHFILKLVLSSQVNKAKKIITPSNTVKNELIRTYGTKISKKILPIYEGINYQVLLTKENKSLSKKYKDFFIYVGNFYPHKNIERLIRAFKKIRGEYKLILIGPDDYFTERISLLIDKIKSKNRIFLIKNPSLDDLVFFYKNALAIIHPSLSEGFGLPLVEAAYFGTPIIASNIKVFKELWKDRYLAFNPYGSLDIADKINQFIKNPTIFNYSDIIKKYSFERMTKQTLTIYNEL